MQISIRNVSKSFQDATRTLTILDNVSYTFPDSCAVAIVGKSGVGKSTLLHLLGALDHPTTGEIFYGDTDITKLKGDARSDFRGAKIGFVFQFHHLLPEFSAVENTAMPLFIAGVPRAEALERATEVLTHVGLGDRTHHRPGTLSGGEQQRVSIARALVSNPEVVLADEPTGNLDLQTGKEIQELLLRVRELTQSTLIVVTHNHELARSMDLVVEMQRGGGLLPEG